MKKKAVVLANGAFPTHHIPLAELENADLIVCCDGAVNKLDAAGFMADIIVGDLDSVQGHLKEKYTGKMFHSSDQETNDLTKAVNWCINHEIAEVVILGATGLRDDHMIGNVFLLPTYVGHIAVSMLTDHGVFTPIVASEQFNSYVGQQVSLFSSHPDVIITTENLKYPVKNQKFSMLWQGTLNESTSNCFTLNIEGGCLIVFQKY
ncbi:thiamine diphosphokinase [Plebeiibacterium marinum]|uniref:Thiamine diphosphokinase n=1 Tax=Plebeiibacterium marinum TaxID=2992111 RepID=A0AAE3MDU3_9BACT|nr:thiamine diphosphokinase [Plebeiobacterium marinum]MCW3806036.1 thiamine diphosphokinase [Plebeiobacterium marinum]